MVERQNVGRIPVLVALLLLTISAFSIGLSLPMPAKASSGNVIAPSGILYYVPITLTNSQNSPTPTPFQQMIQVDSATYSTYEASNLQNVEFFDSNGNIIPSWMESGNSNTAADTVYWLKLTNGIAASSSVTVYMGLADTSMSFFNSQTTGEAPQLSSSYGQYDDGANVFGFYDNFMGTSLNTAIWNNAVVGTIHNSNYVCPLGSGGITIDDGLTEQAVSAAGCASAIHLYSKATFSPSILETLVASTNAPTSGPDDVGWNIAYDTSAPGNVAPEVEGYTNAYYFGGQGEILASNPFPSQITLVLNGGGVGNLLATSTLVTTGVMSLEWPAAGTQMAFADYSKMLSAGDTSLGYVNSYIDIVFNTAAPSTYFAAYQWVRTRAYPPNGVMPTAAFGNLMVANSQGVVCQGSAIMISGITPQQGQNNARNYIQISGCGFLKATSVKFQGVDCTLDSICPNVSLCTAFEPLWGCFTIGNDNEIQIDTPITPTTGPIVVVVSDADGDQSVPNCSLGQSYCNEFFFLPHPSCGGNPNGYPLASLDNPIPDLQSGTLSLDVLSLTADLKVTGSAQLCWSASNLWDWTTYQIYGSGSLNIHADLSLAITGELVNAGSDDPVPIVGPFPIDGTPIAVSLAFQANADISASLSVTESYDAKIDFSTFCFSIGGSCVSPGGQSSMLTLPTFSCIPTQDQTKACLTFSENPPSGEFTAEAHLGLEIGIDVPYLMDAYVFPNAYLQYTYDSSGSALTANVNVIAHAQILGADATYTSPDLFNPPIPISSSGSAHSSVSSGSGGVDLTSTTGVALSFSGSSAADGTPFTVDAGQLTVPPTGVASAPLDVSYFNVSLSGVSNGEGRVCIVSPPDVMLFWNGTTWITPSDISASGGVVCGNIPVSQLSNAIVAIGSQTMLASTSANIFPGKKVILTATVTDSSAEPTTPKGTVTFSDNGAGGTFKTPTCTLKRVATGESRCSVSYSTSAPGEVSINALYAGDSSHQASSSSASLTVLSEKTQVMLAFSKTSRLVGIPINFTATVKDSGPGVKTQPAGVIQWSDRGMGGIFSNSTCTLVGQTVSSSTCFVTYIPESPGKIVVTAAYPGNAQHENSLHNSAVKISGRPTKTKVQASVTMVSSGGLVTLNATVTDVGAGVAMVPLGSLTWTASRSGGTFSSVSCALIPINSTTSGCSVTYTAPSTTGRVTLACKYQNDLAHKASSVKFALKVS